MAPKPELYSKHIIKVIPRNWFEPITEFYAVAGSDLTETSPLTTTEIDNELVEVVPYDLRYDKTFVYVAAVKNLVPVSKDGRIPNLKWAVTHDERVAYYSLSVTKACILGKINGWFIPGASEGLYTPFCQQTALHIVAKGQSKYLFESVLKRLDRSSVLKRTRCTPNKYMRTSDTVLHQIVENERMDLFRSLVKIRPELMRPLANIAGTSGYIPLHLAVINNNQEMIDILLPHTRSISICGSHDDGDAMWEGKGTVLDDALMRGNRKLVKTLISDDYLLESLVRRSPQLLHKAAKCPYRIFKIIFEAYLAAGHDLMETQSGTTFFALMIQLHNSACITRIMKHPSFDAKLLTQPDSHGNTPLCWAASEGLYRVCKRLYPTYASADLLLEKDEMGLSVLAVTCRNSGRRSDDPHVSYQAVVNILLSNPTIRRELISTDDYSGLSPLALTVDNEGSHDVIKTLYDLMTPAQICRQYTSKRHTVLHLAINRKGTALIDILLKDKDKCRDLPALVDAKGQTALQLSNDPLHREQHSRLADVLKTFKQ